MRYICLDASGSGSCGGGKKSFDSCCQECGDKNWCMEKCDYTHDNGCMVKTLEKPKDMDGKELNVGDIVLVATGNKTITRATIESITEHGYLKLHTLKNRRTGANSNNVLLDLRNEWRL